MQDNSSLRMIRLPHGRRAGLGERIEVACATKMNVPFADDPAASDFDGCDLEAEYTAHGKALALVWQQDTATANGIYAYNPTAEAGSRWTRVAQLHRTRLAETEIFVRWGEKWGQLRFYYRSDDHVIPVFDRPISVEHGSYEAESLSGLSALLTGYTPASGDLIWVQDEGLFVAKTGAWIKIAVPRDPETPDITPDNFASVISRVYERMVGAACSEGDVVGTFEWHELAISPTLLEEA